MPLWLIWLQHSSLEPTVKSDSCLCTCVCSDCSQCCCTVTQCTADCPDTGDCLCPPDCQRQQHQCPPCLCVQPPKNPNKQPTTSDSRTVSLMEHQESKHEYLEDRQRRQFLMERKKRRLQAAAGPKHEDSSASRNIQASAKRNKDASSRRNNEQNITASVRVGKRLPPGEDVCVATSKDDHSKDGPANSYKRDLQDKRSHTGLFKQLSGFVRTTKKK